MALGNKHTYRGIVKLTMILIIKPVGVILVTAVDEQENATRRQWNVHAPGCDVFISRCFSFRLLEFPVVEIQGRQLLAWANGF